MSEHCARIFICYLHCRVIRLRHDWKYTANLLAVEAPGGGKVSEDHSAVNQRDSSISGDVSEPPGASPAPPQPSPVPWVQAVGTATAFVAVGLGLVYGLGAISIGLRLWYIKDPVTPVLGQLPSSFLLVDAFSELILPVIVVGAAAYFILTFPVINSCWEWLTANECQKRRCLVLCFFALLLALAPLGFLRWNYRKAGVIRPYLEIYGICALLSIASIYLAFRALVLVREHEQQPESEREIRRGRQRSVALSKAGRVVQRMGIAALALAPWATFTFAAAAPLPAVYLCGPSFNHEDSSGRHYAVGNLIGTSSQWAYIAETRFSPTGSNIGNYIAIIPLSEVQLQAIGNDGECNDLFPPSQPEG
jgi:hypothetical protein